LAPLIQMDWAEIESFAPDAHPASSHARCMPVRRCGRCSLVQLSWSELEFASKKSVAGLVLELALNVGIQLNARTSLLMREGRASRGA
jgi:hypothetical protein